MPAEEEGLARDKKVVLTKAHGPNNAITDVPGIRVGHYQKADSGYLTGTTVVWAPGGATGSAYVGGGWPGTVNTDVLQPGKNEQKLDAVMLSGGSYFGLDAFGGVIRWLEENKQGVSVGPTPSHVDPLVAGAVVFDLDRGGVFSARPDGTFGREAIARASGGKIEQGNVGAGIGTQTNGDIRFKGGVGTSSAVIGGSVTVGAIAVVNPLGTPVDPTDCSLRGTSINIDNEFSGYRKPDPQECEKLKSAATRISEAGSTKSSSAHPNTTISVIATDAKLTKHQARELAKALNDGYAGIITPFNAAEDGDSVFTMATDRVEVSDEQFQELLGVARELAGRTVAHAMLSAKSTHAIQSYCDALPAACLP
ncbi:P1 family peptidase [Amycolatopsis sp. A1MSW2902]|uniref:P1 family peptidase n=1 Tax=Amycolatopsis sp. A1MSW2902 TaxID=687413 RepID=UPI00307EAD32